MRNRNGITLIALIVTIIVLLILAGVSITALTDDEKGIVTKAKYAKEETEKSAAQEEKEIQEILNYAESESTNASTPTTCTVTFSYKDSSGASVTSVVTVVRGGNVADTEIPVVESYSDGTYEFTFDKWVTESGGSTQAVLTNITTNTTVYALYTTDYVCFVAGTKVLTEYGLVNIEDIKVGMKVYSYNEKTKEVELKSVLRTFINYTDKDITKVIINDEIIESTSGHKYYEVNKGWISARDLIKGDIVLDSNNEEVVVEKVETIEFTGNELNTVYNFEVEDNHNYYVGENNVLVHNYDVNPSLPDVC